MKMLKDFINELKGTERKSDNTINSYMKDIRAYESWLMDTEKKEFEQTTVEDIKAYMAYLSTDCVGMGNKKGLAPTTVNRKVSSLQKAFDFLIEKGVANENPAKSVKRQKTDKNKKPSFMIEEEVEMFLGAIQNDERRGIKPEAKVRDYALMRLMIATGLRVSEACSLTVKNFNFRRKELTVIGKGNKSRTLPLSDTIIKIIKDYLEIRNNFKPTCDALFVSKQGNNTKPRDVNKMIKTYCEIAGLNPEEFHAHSLRHTCATLTYKHNQGNLRAVQEQLGHSNIGTTQIYTQLVGDALRRSAMANPFA